MYNESVALLEATFYILKWYNILTLCPEKKMAQHVHVHDFRMFSLSFYDPRDYWVRLITKSLKLKVLNEN